MSVERKSQKTRKHGMGFISTLTLIFIVLKLTGHISWPWLWVLSPIWISFTLMAMAFAAILVGGRIVKGKW